jgi:hypothetical protein
MDTLYKVAKMMPNHNGSPVYQGTVTVTNEYGEIRSQWNLTSDSTDQYKAPLFEMKKTMDQYGHPHPTGFMTDNPRPFENFILETFPSVQAWQDHLDNIIKNDTVVARQDHLNNIIENHTAPPLGDNLEIGLGGLGPTTNATTEPPPYAYLNNYERMNTCAWALQDVIRACPTNERVLSLDAE